VKKLVPSKLPSRTTLPAETPELVVIFLVATALARLTPPSRPVPAPRAETADSDLIGCTPREWASMVWPVESMKLIGQIP
jgi:hypothetical protein